MEKLYLNLKNQCSNFGCKALLFLVFFTTIQQHINAQEAQYYSFSQSEEVYTPLENPNEILTTSGTSGNAILDDVNSSSINLPFNFSFNGNNFTSLFINTNGYLTFGAAGTASSSPLSNTNNTSSTGIISVFGADLKGFYNIAGIENSTINTEILGDFPNRSFVVEWKNFRLYGNTDAAYIKLNFQVYLNEDGTISFKYDSSSVGSASSTNVQVGLKGTGNTNFTNRYAQGNTTSNWTSSTIGGDALSGIATNVTSSLPPSGLTFNWSLPSECIAPTAQPTNLILTNSGIVINGTYTAANPAPDRYLILRHLEGETPNIPVDGTTYPLGQNALLNTYVVHYGTNTTFENNYNNGAIRGNNTYVYTIYAVNSNCTGGPLYLLDNPTTEAITNCPISLNGITAGTPTVNSFILNWSQGENGNALPMSRIIEVATDENFTNMIAGSPFTLSASDLTLPVNDLDANTKYYFRGKNTTSYCESAYSSTGNIYTSCLPIPEFNENFDSAPTVNFSLQLPNCWSKITVGVTSSVPTVNVTPTYHNSAPNGVTFYGNGADMTNLDNKAILVSPQLTNIGEGTHRLRFNAKMSSSGATYDLQVVTLSSNTADATIELIDTITASQLSATYQEFSVNFNNYSGTANYLGIRRINGNTYSYLCVDDIIWEEIPSCPALPSIIASDSTVSGATISWEDNFETPENGYEYFISTTNALPSESETFETTSNSYAVISGLANGTYYAFVRRACSEDDKSPWRQTSFSTVPTTSAPWLEEFGNSTPAGWTTTGWSLGTSAGYPGNSGMNLYKNLYGSFPTGTFTTIAVGPLNTDNYELSFDYRQGNFNSPYAPLETWGNFTVEVSSDFGVTWNQIGIVNNNEDNNQNIGTQLQYVKKAYSLADYQGEYVKIRISATRTAGDFYLSFDNFEIKAPVVEIEGIAVATQNDIPAEITTANGTLQLVAFIYPSEANQEVTWSVISGNEFASVDANGLVTAIANGTATIRTTSAEDNTMFDEIDVTINISEEIGYCIPEFFYPSSSAGIKLDQISLVGETITWDVNPVAYSENGYADYTNSQSANLIPGNTYDLNFYTDWQDPHYINVRAWIDYNQNNQFDNDEEIGYVINGIDASGEGIFNFTVPENTVEGIYRLRAILQFPNATPNNLTPCGTINSYGIAIDYNIQVINEISDNYCDVSVEWDVEPITLVNLSNLNNPTSATINATPAYEDFTSMIANVEQGEPYTITVKGNTGTLEHDIRVFIDWNQDFVFDMDTEYYTASLLPSTGEDDTVATIDIIVPENATLGNTRMRITKDLWNVYEEGEFDACTDAYYGQVEDYTINVQESLNVDHFDKNNVRIFPNPTTDFVTIQSELTIKNIMIFNQLGQLITTQKSNTVDLSNVPSGVYVIKIQTDNNIPTTQKIIKK